MKRKDDVDHPVFGSARLVKRKDYMLEEDTSYFTPYSNVVLLHDLYQTRAYDPLRPTLPVTLRHYVQGIGTHVELDADGIPTPDGYEEDDKLGRATGRGPNGVVARVEEVLALVGAQVQRLMQVHNVAVRTLRFDLFGFSRGAAAARFCANELTRPANAKQERPAHGYLGKWLTDANVPLPAAVEVRFVGLFDTVVSDSTADGVADKYKVLLPLLFTEPGNVLYNDWHTQSEALGLGKSEPLYTSLKRVTGKVMHIVAKDEYRVRFPLTVSDAPHNYNLYLHGAHSDIGGGYAEMPAEAVVRFADVSVADTAADLAALNATAGSYRVRYTRRFVGGKWVADATPKGSPERRRITVEKSDEHRTMANPGISTGPSMPAVKLSDHYLVINNGFISNKLALVAFNALLQYALLQKLPFEPDLKKAKVKRPEFYTPPQQTPYFTAYYEAIEKMVKNPVAETTTFPPEVSFPLYEHFVHSSANYNQSIALRERAGETSAALGLYANEPRVITVVDPKTRERKDIMQRQYLQPADHEE